LFLYSSTCLKKKKYGRRPISASDISEIFESEEINIYIKDE